MLSDSHEGADIRVPTMDIVFIVMMTPAIPVSFVPDIASIREENCTYEKPFNVKEGENLRLTAHNLPERGLCTFWFEGCCYGDDCEENNKNCHPEKYLVEVFNKREVAPFRCTIFITNVSANDVGYIVARNGGYKNSTQFADCITRMERREPSNESFFSNNWPWVIVTLVLSHLLFLCFGVLAHRLYQRRHNGHTICNGQEQET